MILGGPIKQNLKKIGFLYNFWLFCTLKKMWDVTDDMLMGHISLKIWYIISTTSNGCLSGNQIFYLAISGIIPSIMQSM